MAQLGKDHFFRSLNGSEEEAVSLIDNRDINDYYHSKSDSDEKRGPANNSLLVVCDHASNDVKMTKVDELRESPLIRSNDGFDPGAADLAAFISEQNKCMALLGNYSKLLIDPSLPLANDNLVRVAYKSDPDQPVTFNDEGYLLSERVVKFYVEYHRVLTEVIWFLQPQVILNVHSHHVPESSSDNTSDVYLQSKSLCLKGVKSDIDRKFESQISCSVTEQPCDSVLCSSHLSDSLTNFYPDKEIKSVYLSVNSDFLQFDDRDRQAELAEIISQFLH